MRKITAGLFISLDGVVDGREAVSFLVAVKERLEAPERMLVEV